jgi:hypothetical protein
MWHRPTGIASILLDGAGFAITTRWRESTGCIPTRVCKAHSVLYWNQFQRVAIRDGTSRVSMQAWVRSNASQRAQLLLVVFETNLEVYSR